jgi:hypothetical protein
MKSILCIGDVMLDVVVKLRRTAVAQRQIPLPGWQNLAALFNSSAKLDLTRLVENLLPS